jgi:hypothetical protein
MALKEEEFFYLTPKQLLDITQGTPERARAAERLLVVFMENRGKYVQAIDLEVLLEEAIAGRELYPVEWP